jgi:hypothetical protein
MSKATKQQSDQEMLDLARGLVVRLRADGYRLPGRTVDEAARLLHEEIVKPNSHWRRVLRMLSFRRHIRNRKLRRQVRRFLRDKGYVIDA